MTGSKVMGINKIPRSENDTARQLVLLSASWSYISRFRPSPRWFQLQRNGQLLVEQYERLDRSQPLKGSA